MQIDAENTVSLAGLVRVAICDAYAPYRELLEHILRRDARFQIVYRGKSLSGSQFVAAARSGIDVVIVDGGLLAAAPSVVPLSPSPCVIELVHRPCGACPAGAGRKGGVTADAPGRRACTLARRAWPDALWSVVSRRSPPAVLIEAIRLAAHREPFVDPAVFADCDGPAECLASSEAELMNVLSERERDVVALVCRHMTDRQIAAALSISEKTASNHVSAVIRKWACDSRGGIVSVILDARTADMSR